MRTAASKARSRVVSVRMRPRRYGSWRHGVGAGIVAAGLTIGMGAFAVPVAPSDVRAAASSGTTSGFTVGLAVFDGEPPFDIDDGPGVDSGPSGGVVREGDSVTYVIDIGVGYVPLSEVVIDLPVPARIHRDIGSGVLRRSIIRRRDRVTVPGRRCGAGQVFHPSCDHDRRPRPRFRGSSAGRCRG